MEMNTGATTATAQQQIGEMLWGFAKARLVYAAAKLGMPDLSKSGPCSASTIARSLNADADMANRLMRGLAWCGLLDHEADDGFLLTPLGMCLCSDADGSMHDNAISMGGSTGRSGATSLVQSGPVRPLFRMPSEWSSSSTSLVTKLPVGVSTG